MNADARLTRLPGLLAVALAAAGCAGGGTAPRSASGSNTLVTADGQAVRCVEERSVGSLIQQRTCRTEEQWRRIEEASRESGRALQGPSYGGREPPPPGAPPL